MGLKKLKTRVKHSISRNPKIDFLFRFLWIKLYQANYFVRYRRFKLEDTIIFECFKGKFINDSPLAIYNELRGLNTGFSYIWVVNSTTDIPNDLAKDEKLTFVKYGSREYFLAYSKSKFWIVNCRIHSSILKKNGQKFIQCWHGTPLKKMAHDIKVGNNVNTSLDSLKYSYQREVSRLDYFLSPSQYASKCFMSSFNMKKNKILEVGYPRNDTLVRFKDNQAYISEVKHKLGLDSTKRVVLYAPTWRDNQFNVKTGKHVLKNILDDESFTRDFAGTIFLYRGHYFTRPESDMNNFIDVSDYSNLNDLFLVADVLITDYSSLFFDFLILEKQVIFYMPDLIEYANQTRGFYLDVTTELPYSIAEDLEGLKKQLNEKIIDIDKTVDFNKQYNPYEDGSSSLRVIKEVGII